MSVRFVALLCVAGLVIAACTSGSGAASAAASRGPSASTTTRIEVSLTDALRIELATMSVRVGVPVTFVVTNSGSTDHEFYLGDEAAQAAHDKDMQSMGGMAHAEHDGIALKPGETKELTHTFAQTGETLVGCHVAGHYAGGMKATITVTG